MAIKKSDAKFTEPFVGKTGVMIMLSVENGQSIASSTKLDYTAVHALEQMIVDLTFVDEQTDCRRCNHFTTETCRDCRGGDLFKDSGYVTETEQTEPKGEE